MNLEERGTVRAFFWLAITAWLAEVSRTVSTLIGLRPAITVLPADLARHGTLAAGHTFGIGGRLWRAGRLGRL